MKSRLLRFGLIVALSAFLLPLALPINSVEAAKGKKVAKTAAKTSTPVMPAEFKDYVQKFQEKKYKEALDGFDKLDRTGYCTDKTHYYMGLCYHNLNQLAAAEQHYSVVYQFSKDPILKYQAAQGRNQVAKYAANRTYSGQGNLFARLSARGGGGGGGIWGGSGGGGGGGGGGG